MSDLTKYSIALFGITFETMEGGLIEVHSTKHNDQTTIVPQTFISATLEDGTVIVIPTYS